MQDRPLEILDVEVILNAAYAGRNDEALAALRAAGLVMSDISDDEGAVEGTILANRLTDLQRLPCVADVRVVFAYETGGDSGRPGPASAPADPHDEQGPQPP